MTLLKIAGMPKFLVGVRKTLTGPNWDKIWVVKVTIYVDGTTVAGGAYFANDDNSGHIRVYSYVRTELRWNQVGSVINGDEPDDNLVMISLSSNGERVATSTGAANKRIGYVRVYDLVENEWLRVGSKIPGQKVEEDFGSSISLSSDGTRLAVGAPSKGAEESMKGVMRLFDIAAPFKA